MMSPHRDHGQRGFTLVEVMVALVIGMAILLALSTFFANNSGNQNELERSTRQIESARFAIDLIAEDLQHAGFYGEFSPDSLPVAATYTTSAACPAAAADLGWVLPVPPAAPQLPVALQGIAAATQPACLEDRRAGTEAVILRRVDTGAAVPPRSRPVWRIAVPAPRQ